MSTEKVSISVDEPIPIRDEYLTQDEKKIEKKVVSRLDLRLLPLLWLLFLVSFIDRANIANAEIQGMNQSLHMKGHDYNVALMVFTLSYVIFGPISNLIFKKVGPRSLGWMMFIWGGLVICQGVTKSFGGLVAARFLMGALESGYISSCAYLVGAYYKRDEFLKRYAIFFSASIATGALNGFFAAVIVKMDGVGGYEGWRWIFIIEGLITIVVSVLTVIFILPFPEHTKLFSEEEKRVLLKRLELDGGNVANDKLDWKVVIKDYKIWLTTLAYIGIEENASSLMSFQPIILKAMGYSSIAAQVHSIPIFAASFVVTMTCAYLCEWLNQRYLFTMFGFSLVLIGTCIELAQPHQLGVKYLGLFFMSSGSYLVLAILPVWIAINVGKGYKRNLALGIVISFGNAGALVSSNVFLTQETPKFHTGFSVGMGFLSLAVVSISIMTAGLIYENRKRDKLRQTMPEVLNEQDLEDLGENHPDFRYKI